MKPINYIELKSIVDHLDQLRGAELQKITGPLDALHFHFWDKGPKILAVSCLLQKPFLAYLDSNKGLKSAFKKRTEERPLSLFIKAHFLGEFVTKVKLHDYHARVFEIHFENNAVLEFRLFTGGGNIGAFRESKHVFLRRPQELKVEDESKYQPDYIRSPQVVFEEGLEQLEARLTKRKGNSSGFEKIEKAKSKIQKAIENLNEGKFLKLAQALESNESLTTDLQELYKDSLSKRENIEWAYKQSKVSEQKRQRLNERLSALMSESSVKKKKAESPLINSKKSPSKKGVQFHLKEGVVLKCGRNAKENLDLLRGAKPWYLWMHLSDYPSGHLIIERPKGYELSASELERCAHFLFLRGAPKKLLNSPTQRYEVMFTECRFVKAQKKSKGLVTTQKHQSLSLVWKSEHMHIF